MVEYRITERKVSYPETGTYDSYGICAYTIECESEKLIACFYDVFSERKKAEELVYLCNSLELDPIHLEDVVEDALS